MNEMAGTENLYFRPFIGTNPNCRITVLLLFRN